MEVFRQTFRCNGGILLGLISHIESSFKTSPMQEHIIVYRAAIVGRNLRSASITKCVIPGSHPSITEKVSLRLPVNVDDNHVNHTEQFYITWTEWWRIFFKFLFPTNELVRPPIHPQPQCITNNRRILEVMYQLLRKAVWCSNSLWYGTTVMGSLGVRELTMTRDSESVDGS